MRALTALGDVAVVTAVALLAVGRLGELPDVEPDRPPVLLPEDRLVESQDVDDVLDRLAADIAERDARIADLERRVAAHSDAPATSESFADVYDAGGAPESPLDTPTAQASGDTVDDGSGTHA